MFRRIYLSFFCIFNRRKIPLLPRGMLASAYPDVPAEERRVMARLGSRDIAGVRRVMRRYGVSTIDELVALLEHQQPRRNVLYRFRLAVGRCIGGHPADPHRADIIRALNLRESRLKGQRHQNIEKRLKNVLVGLK